MEITRAMTVLGPHLYQALVELFYLHQFQSFQPVCEVGFIISILLMKKGDITELRNVLKITQPKEGMGSDIKDYLIPAPILLVYQKDKGSQILDRVVGRTLYNLQGFQMPWSWRVRTGEDQKLIPSQNFSCHYGQFILFTRRTRGRPQRLKST